jgi:SAM-dependent methyltransferase
VSGNDDSSRPEYWEPLYREARTPWDQGGVPSALDEFLQIFPPPARVLVPGCGSGYEVTRFAEAGFDVTGIDFSPAAVERARQLTGQWSKHVRQADFFALDEEDGVDLIYERAFLCALPPRLWEDYAKQCARLLRPGGLLAGFFFFRDDELGPPYGLQAGELEALLAADFECVDERGVSGSIPVFEGRERWQTWRREPVADEQ